MGNAAPGAAEPRAPSAEEEVVLAGLRERMLTAVGGDCDRLLRRALEALGAEDISSLGFPTADAAALFRGVGLLGLEVLVELAERAPSRVLAATDVYPWAAAVAALTAVLCEELEIRDLVKSDDKRHWQLLQSPDAFLSLVALAWSAFDREWRRVADRDELQFEAVVGTTRERLRALLAHGFGDVPALEAAAEQAAVENTDAFRMAVLGAVDVGKSALVMRFMRNSFDGDYDPTAGCDEYRCERDVDSLVSRLSVLDTSGMHEYASQEWLRGRQVFVVVYDVTRLDTLQEARATLEALAPVRKLTSAVAMLVGNKADLPAEERVVAAAEGRAVAAEFRAYFVETSALTGAGVHDALFAAAVRHARGDVCMQGTVSKQAHLTHRWQPRFFVLNGRLLRYYASAAEHSGGAPERGSVQLDRAAAVVPKVGGQFQVVTAARTLTLEAESLELADEWVAQLRHAIECAPSAIVAAARPRASTSFAGRGSFGGWSRRGSGGGVPAGLEPA